MKIELLGRTAPTIPLTKAGKFKRYEDAVIEGQQRFGKGNFTVSMTARAPNGTIQEVCPTRDQQLLKITVDSDLDI